MAKRSARAIWLGALAVGLTPLSSVAAAQDEAPPAERDLYLECTAQSGQYKSYRLAINAEHMRARSRTFDSTSGGMTYGVRYETDEIILYPNRLPPGPGNIKRAIDRKTLALTYFQTVGIDSPERIVVGTAQCREIAPVPGLMPFEKRSGQ
jgi:hypothetical protein